MMEAGKLIALLGALFIGSPALGHSRTDHVDFCGGSIASTRKFVIKEDPISPYQHACQCWIRPTRMTQEVAGVRNMELVATYYIHKRASLDACIYRLTIGHVHQCLKQVGSALQSTHKRTHLKANDAFVVNFEKNHLDKNSTVRWSEQSIRVQITSDPGYSNMSVTCKTVSSGPQSSQHGDNALYLSSGIIMGTAVGLILITAALAIIYYFTRQSQKNQRYASMSPLVISGSLENVGFDDTSGEVRQTPYMADAVAYNKPTQVV